MQYLHELGQGLQMKANQNFFRTNQLLPADKSEGIHHLRPLKHSRFHQTAVIHTGLEEEEEEEEQAISMSFSRQEGSFLTHTVRITG